MSNEANPDDRDYKAISAELAKRVVWALKFMNVERDEP